MTHPPDAIPDGTSAIKVLLFDLDGIRRDKLHEARTPNIDALAADGTFGPALTHDPHKYNARTDSGPGHSNILTGVWPDKHHVTDNAIEPNDLATYPDFLTRLSALRPELSTFAIGDWPPLIDQIIATPAVKVLHPFTDADGHARESTRLTVAWATQAVTEQNPDVGYVYFIRADHVAHAHGAMSAEYLAAIEEVDEAVGSIIHAVRSRPTLDREDWLFLVATDHGHLDEGGHGGDESEIREIWTLAAGGDVPRVPPGHGEARMVDLAPTALAHLGVHIDPSWGLDGVPMIMGSRRNGPPA